MNFYDPHDDVLDQEKLLTRDERKAIFDLVSKLVKLKMTTLKVNGFESIFPTNQVPEHLKIKIRETFENMDYSAMFVENKRDSTTEIIVREIA